MLISQLARIIHITLLFGIYIIAFCRVLLNTYSFLNLCIFIFGITGRNLPEKIIDRNFRLLFILHTIQYLTSYIKLIFRNTFFHYQYCWHLLIITFQK